MKKYLIILILALASFLRLVNLSNLPNSYTPDELAQSYTAYSFLKTGADEWGNKNILKLKSFGDYKPPLQTIFLIPSTKLFGLTPLAARLPSAIFGILTILFVYLFALKFFTLDIALLSSLLCTFSFTMLPLSRLALEANILIFIIITATYFFFSLPVLSAILFSLSFITYHSAKIITPLIVVYLLYFYKDKIKKFLPTFLILSLILIKLSWSPSRSSDIIITHPTDNWQGLSSDQYEARQNGLHPFITRVFNNKLTYTLKTLATNYFSYFSPQFLATSGAGETTYGMLPGFGIIGIVCYFFVIFYLLSLLKSKKLNPNIKLLLFFIIIAPLPAALSKGSYSANRTSIISPFIQILCSIAIINILPKLPKILRYILCFILVFEILFFTQKYFYQGNQQLSGGMLFGRREAIEKVKSLGINYQNIIISRQLSEPQAYASFFFPIDPKTFQQDSKEFANFDKTFSFLDQLGEYKIDKYIFRNIDFVKEKQLPNILIGTPQEIPQDQAKIIIYHPSHSQTNPAVHIYYEN